MDYMGLVGSLYSKNNNVLYETPSKSKLALLENPPKTYVSTKLTKSENGNGIEVVPGAPTKFQNCKELNKVYPQGVKKGILLMRQSMTEIRITGHVKDNMSTKFNGVS